MCGYLVHLGRADDEGDLAKVHDSLPAATHASR